MDLGEKINNLLYKKNDCLIWKGFVRQSGTRPAIHHNGKYIFIKNYFFYQNSNIETNYVKLSNTCGDVLCCNPEHLYVKNRGIFIKKTIEDREALINTLKGLDLLLLDTKETDWKYNHIINQKISILKMLS